MTQISLTDAALVRLLAGCAFPGVDVASGPFEWDGAYVTRLLSAAPAIRVVFRGAEEYDGDKTTELILAGQWAIYVVTGWNGKDQAARRLGAGAGYDLLHRAAAALHSAILTEANGERLPIASVTGIEVLADSALDISNLWLAGISVSVELPLPLLETDACYGPLDDYLRTRATFDIPGAGHDFDPDAGDEIGVDGDVTSQFDQPQ